MNTYYGITLHDNGTTGEIMTIRCDKRPPTILEDDKRTYWLDSRQDAEGFRDAFLDERLIEE